MDNISKNGIAELVYDRYLYLNYVGEEKGIRYFVVFVEIFRKLDRRSADAPFGFLANFLATRIYNAARISLLFVSFPFFS